MNPVQIEVLLNVYYKENAPILEPTSAVKESVRFWAAQHCIDRKDDGSRWELTERGLAMVKLYKRVQLPKMAWVDEEDQVIL